MLLFEHTFAEPHENLAVEEAWLDHAESDEAADEVLRIWESPHTMVVLGRSSTAEEARLEHCRQHHVPVLRRCSGGAAVVAGRGCLMYAVVLDCRRRPQLRSIDEAHRTVLERLAAAVRQAVPPQDASKIQHRGLSDLAWGDLKFSGNSLRCKRDHVLYHGTVLYDFPLQQVSDLLGPAPRQPDYRGGRDHLQFVTNVALDPRVFREALIDQWRATSVTTQWPRGPWEALRQKYAEPLWRLA